LHSAVLVGAVGACTDPPGTAALSQASTVGDQVSGGGCSTAVVLGLSQQVAEQANCEHPGNFVPFMAAGGITFTSNAVLPYIEQGARDDLIAVATTDPIQINSGLRTLAQQYLLYKWFQAGECGISAAATVGNSNHEGGRAVDLENWSDRVTQMAAHGWAHDVSNDPVHFDHTSSPDNRGEDVHAFQTLWNLNNPGDQITADGSYGPQTEARLVQSPATGFAMGATCNTQPPTLGVQLVSVDGPDRVPPETKQLYAIVLKNTGDGTWPASTGLEVASGGPSALYDPSWMSQTQVTTLGDAVAPGDMITVMFDVLTPAETVSTPITETFALDDAGTTFGMIDLSLTVVPGQGSGSSGDGEGSGTGGKGGGGCDAGAGAGSWLLLAAPALVVAARRRRR
jgi:hypothetical protein